MTSLLSPVAASVLCALAISGLRLGQVEVPAFEAIALPPRVRAATTGGYDLTIGIPELKQFVVEIDLHSNTFCLHSRVPSPSLALRSFELARNHAIVVPVTLGPRRLERFIFDTGAGVTTLTESWLPQIPHRKRPESVVSVDGSGVRRSQSFVEVDRICLFDHCKPKQVVMPDRDLSALNGFRVDGILGMSFLKGSRIVLDLPGSRVAIGAT